MKHRLIDHHVHTQYSPDANCEATMEKYMLKAQSLGKDAVIFSDHVDMDTPVELFSTYPDYEAYYQKVKRLSTSNFKVLMGVEIGYQAHLKKALNTFSSEHPFDFVIASIHAGDGLDFYNGDFFKHTSMEDAIKRYFEIVLEMVKNYDNYDILGHIDYIIRYGDTSVNDYDINQYQPLLDEILTTVIQQGKGIEINTSGLRNHLNLFHPKKALLKRYKDLGGTLITIGSDAHTVDDLYAGFDEALSLLKSLGFKYLARFENRVPTLIPID